MSRKPRSGRPRRSPRPHRRSTSPRVSPEEAKKRLLNALTSARDTSPLGQHLLFVEVLTGLCHPIGLLAGSLAPRSAYQSYEAWLRGVLRQAIVPLFERLQIVVGDADLPLADSPTVKNLADAYGKAGQASSKCHIDRDDDLFRTACGHKIARRYDPMLPAPEEVSLTESLRTRELRMRAAEEVLLAVGFADAYQIYEWGCEWLEAQASEEERLREYGRHYTALLDAVKSFRRQALNVRLHRQHRLHNVLFDSRKKDGITEWRKLEEEFYHRLGFRPAEANPERDIIDLMAQAERRPPRSFEDLSIDELRNKERDWETLREAIRGSLNRKPRGRSRAKRSR